MFRTDKLNCINSKCEVEVKNLDLMFTYVSGNFVLEGNDELEGARLFSY